MSRTVRVLLAGTVVASAVLTGTSACSLRSAPEPDHVITSSRLPEDDSPGRSKQQALEFREYLANNRPDYAPLAEHVVGVRGSWNSEGGRVFIATDYPGGPGSPGGHVAPRVAEAFASWATTDDRTGNAAVYDRSGALMYAGGRF